MQPGLQHSILRAYRQILATEEDPTLRYAARKSMRDVKKRGQIYASSDNEALARQMKRQHPRIQNSGLQSKFADLIDTLEACASSDLSSSEASDMERYKVHSIIGFRLKGENNHREYLVCWKGYDSCDDTWEPAHSLMEDGCGELIAQFHKEHMRFH